jgi:hypothetical protein
MFGNKRGRCAPIACCSCAALGIVLVGTVMVIARLPGMKALIAESRARAHQAVARQRYAAQVEPIVGDIGTAIERLEANSNRALKDPKVMGTVTWVKTQLDTFDKLDAASARISNLKPPTDGIALQKKLTAFAAAERKMTRLYRRALEELRRRREERGRVGPRGRRRQSRAGPVQRRLAPLLALVAVALRTSRVAGRTPARRATSRQPAALRIARSPSQPPICVATIPAAIRNAAIPVRRVAY